jgi:hypothetical protein
MKMIISTIAFSLSLSVYAGECDKFQISKADLSNPLAVEKMPEIILTHYQQPKATESDFVADISLLRKAQSTPKKIWWSLTDSSNEKINAFVKDMESGKKCAEELFIKTYDANDKSLPVAPVVRQVRGRDLEQIAKSNISEEKKNALAEKLKLNKIYLEGHENPIKAKEFAYMIDQIIIDGFGEGITPKYGMVHEWSEEFKSSKVKKYSVMGKFSKLLIALARGETSQYMLSGSEEQLETWILDQEINSLYPHDLIKASYRINNGDMYLTLLTIENVLNRYWRVLNRQDLPVTIRLRPIINSFGQDGDNFGSWYHMFGIMLYGYVEGPLSARAVGGVESLGSHILEKFEDEKQEDFVNSQGAIIGARLARSIRASGYQEIKRDKSRLSPDYYLNLNEDFSKRIEKL